MSFHGGVVHLYCERWRESGSELLLAAIAAMFFLPARYLNEQSLIFIGRFTEHQSEIVLEAALVYYTLRMSHRGIKMAASSFQSMRTFWKEFNLPELQVRQVSVLSCLQIVYKCFSLNISGHFLVFLGI